MDDYMRDSSVHQVLKSPANTMAEAWDARECEREYSASMPAQDRDTKRMGSMIMPMVRVRIKAGRSIGSRR